jgi:hypothetical protein
VIGKKTRALLRFASKALSGDRVGDLPSGPLFEQLDAVLAKRNGFYAFDSALFFRGFGASAGDIVAWNDPQSWRQAYGEDALGSFFFAEDVFGFQFGIKNDAVVVFDPETGKSNVVASDLDEFAGKVLADRDGMAGCGLAKSWQNANGPLTAGTRLFPSIPFVLGGSVGAENFYPMNDLTGMRERAELARQIRDVPDGSKFRIKWVDD